MQSVRIVYGPWLFLGLIFAGCNGGGFFPQNATEAYSTLHGDSGVKPLRSYELLVEDLRTLSQRHSDTRNQGVNQKCNRVAMLNPMTFG
jgi:hypothetical protein